MTNDRLQSKTVSAARWLRAMVAGAVALVGTASAVEIDVGNPDVRFRWDNTLRYNLGMRAQGKDPAIARSTTYDESDNRFDRGEFVTNRLDLLAEADVVYQRRYGLRVSGTGWFDGAYDKKSVTASGTIPAGTTGAGLTYSSVSSYVDQKYTDRTKNYHYGPYGELLDAFAFGSFDVGDMLLSVKAGRHTLYWGESLFSPIHGVSYSQGPVDLGKGQATPGTEAKELFMPLTQVSATMQLTDRLSAAGQYYVEWRPFRIPEGGTYLAGSDIALEGPQRTLAAVVEGNPVFLNRVDAVEPDRWGGRDWGANLKYRSDAIGTIGLYARRFDEKFFWLLRTTPSAPAQGYRAVYPKGTTLFGLSVNRRLLDASVGLDLVYRHDTALQTRGFAARDEGARGDTFHAVLNAVYAFKPTPLFSSASLAVEGTYNTWLDVNQNRDLFNSVDHACVAPSSPTVAGSGRVSDGCATKHFVGGNLSFTANWLQVFPGADLSLPVSFGTGIYGNSAVLAGGNQGAGSYSAGLGLDYRLKYRFDVKYIGYIASHNTNPTSGLVSSSNGTQIQDRGWVAFTFKTTI